MADATSRAVGAVEDVVAIERIAPGLLQVVTWSDSYPVDAQGAGCNCPDKQYHDAERCKHERACVLATSDNLPAPWDIAEDLDSGPEPLPDFEEFDAEGEYV